MSVMFTGIQPPNDYGPNFLIGERFTFANEYWQPEVVAHLKYLVSRQTTPRENATGLVIGSGGLPYILAYIGVSQLIVADIDNEVVESTLDRTARLEEHDGWSTYEYAVKEDLHTDFDRKCYLSEITKASRSGLRADFAKTKAGLATTQLFGLHVDFIDKAGELGSRLYGQGRSITFINLSNTAEFIGKIGVSRINRRAHGRQILRHAIDYLPLAEDAIIVDSSYDPNRLVPLLFDSISYPPLISVQSEQ
jgi:hypothetical protein